MIDVAFRATVVFSFAFAVAALLRRATPATRHLLWHVTLLIVVAAPLLRPFAPRIEVPNFISMSLTRAAENVANSYVAQPFRAARPAWAGLKACATCGEEQSGPQPTGPEPQASSLSLMWAIGSTIAGLWFVIGWLTSLWMAARASHVPELIVLEAGAVARELGMKHAPDVRVMKGVRGPLTVGIVHPVILLPALAMEWHADRRRAVFAHELAHVRRRDTRTQALAHIACALYWFNPLAWLAARALRRERERACDDVVIGLGVRPSSYAQDLLDIAQVLGSRVSPSAALAMARRSELEGRLVSLLAGNRPRRPARGTTWTLPCVMTLCATVTFGANPSGQAQSTSVERPPSPLMWHDVGPDPIAKSRQIRSAARALSQSDDEDVREHAAMELGISSDSTVIEALIAALHDPSGQVREKAAIGLFLRRDPRVVDALLVAATDPDAQVREKVMMALGTSGDPRAIATLKAAMHDSEEQVREKAAIGLVLLTTSPLGPIDRQALESGLTWVVNSVLRAIR